MAEYRNSIAQDRVQFPIQTIIRPQNGAQYSRVVIYITDADVATYLSSALAKGSVLTVQSNTYSTATKGALKDHLALFFASASTGVVYVVNPLDVDEDLSKTYEETKTLGYFKTALSEASFNANNVALAKLCTADTENSQHFITVSDNVTGGDLAQGTVAKLLTDAKCNSFVKYHPTLDIALAQIGKSISSINGTGTPIGNSLDMIAINTITASGDNKKNLTITQKDNCDKNKIGYATAVGDGTEYIAIEGSMDLNGNSVGAMWCKAYIAYMCRVKTANFITQGNVFNNNNSYVAICSILRDMVSRFEAIGRFRDVHFKYPSYATAVESGYVKGDQINIPDAWEATYIDNVREVRIYGTLYIDKPTR